MRSPVLHSRCRFLRPARIRLMGCRNEGAAREFSASSRPRQTVREAPMSQGRYFPRLQVSLATLLWLTLCVASFFGGGYWERMAKLQATVAKAMAAAKPAVSQT